MNLSQAWNKKEYALSLLKHFYSMLESNKVNNKTIVWIKTDISAGTFQ